ncbi:GNAT family N-acetyltransferase [Pendulispora albinea]|uniref:GNAT family N-acetyltransferase n=1 Tax=Pendulispora albinea TaxID=2741071 RepID=A0ABZ2M4I7_9BACT
MRMPVLETPRLAIRPFHLDDLAACHALLDANGGEESGSLEERERWLRWTLLNYGELERLHQPPYGDRAVIHRASGLLIGSCGLVPCLLPRVPAPHARARAHAKRFVPEVGLYYAFSRGERGKGYATEAAGALIDWAMRELHLQRILAMTTYENARSRRVMERLGMRIYENPDPDPPWLQIVGILESDADSSELDV